MSGAEADSITARQLRDALGHLPTGVTVVTTLDPAGEPVGTTVSAVCSVSAEPALLLVCLARSSATLTALHSHGAFTVNVLGVEQHEISTNFARTGTQASWEAVAHGRSPSGLPHLAEAAATFECEVHRSYDGGDHVIVVGRVLAVAVDATREPLLHLRGRYARAQA